MTRRSSAAQFAALCFAAPAFAQSQDTTSGASPPATAASQPSDPALKVEVTGKQIRPANDYRTDSVDSLGPLGTVKIQDAPYSIGVLPAALLENSQARNFKDVSKYLPLVQYQEQQGPDILRPQTRGLQGGNFQNSRMDGMTMFVTVANAIEQFQQIEVVNGLSANLYGPANPSGMFNFVSKRPTAQDQFRVTVGYESSGILTEHADLSGHVDSSGVLAYRINVLTGNGQGYVDGSHLSRDLGDLALDIRPDRDTVVELNYSDYHLQTRGYPGWFTYGESIVLPSAPDPKRVGYGQSYAGVDMETRMGSARVKHDFDSNWHLVAGVLDQDARRDINTPVDNLTTNAGAYTSSLANGFAPRFRILSDMAYLDGKFATGALSHELVVGTAGYEAKSFAVTHAATAASVLLGKANINDPQAFAMPAAGLPDSVDNFDSSNNFQQGVNVSDTIGFGEKWSTRLGVSEDKFRTTNFNAQGVKTPSYSSSGASPSASLIFKPAPSVTTYVTYASSLQPGDLASSTAANAGSGLPPYRSTEWEAGAKATVGKVDLTAAVFRIERPFANIDPVDKVFKISGDQVNKGLELSAIGEVIDRVTVYSGLLLLDARLRDTGSAATDDRYFVGAPRYKGNVLVEYLVPGVDGLVATVDWQYSGKRAGNDTNSFYVPGYNLFDLGTRYVDAILGKRVTWRLAVDNVANTNYWSTVGPSNLTGTNTGSLIAHLGSPRTVLASATIDF